MTRALLGVVVVVLAAASPADANLGAPTRGGQLAGEPGGIADVAIAREVLVLDLRPVARGERVAVTATYQLDNRGDARTLDLVFASGSNRLADLGITLDGQPVAAHLVDAGDLPASWRAPTATPLADGGTLGFYLRDNRGAAGLVLEVPPGPHELAISYTAQTMTHHAGRPVLLHQFVYVLSPARTWAGFGGLDVTLHAPPGWIVAVTPAMTRTGDTLRATYATIPADAIALTIHAPTGAYPILAVAGWIALALAVIGGGLLVWQIAARRARRRAQVSPLASAGADAFLLAVAWSLVVLGAGIFAIVGPGQALPADQVDHRGYGDEIAIFLLAIGSFVVFGIGIGLARYAARRAG